MAEPKGKEKFEFDAANFTVDAIQRGEEDEAKSAEKAMLREAEKRQSAKASEKMVESAIKMNEAREKQMLKSKEKTAAEKEDAQKKALETKIKKYLQAFPGLSQVIPKPSARASIPELEEIVELIRGEISSQRSLMRVAGYAHQALGLLESTWGDGSGAPAFVPAPLRIDLRGMTKLYQLGAFEKELTPLLIEIDIEYPWIGRSNLLMRGMETLASVSAKTHKINTDPKFRDLVLRELSGEKAKQGVDLDGL